MLITIDIDMEKQKINKVDAGDLNPITAASILAGVVSGLLSSVKLEVKPKSSIVTPEAGIIKPKIKIVNK